jgi:hypothetical protein
MERLREVARRPEPDRRHHATRLPQRVEEARLVLFALTLDQIGIGVFDAGSPPVLKRNAELELRQVLAGHEVREV